jgi:hypothetical protein
VCKVVDSNGNGWGGGGRGRGRGGALLHLFYIPKKPVRDRGMDLKIHRVYNIFLTCFIPVSTCKTFTCIKGFYIEFY